MGGFTVLPDAQSSAESRDVTARKLRKYFRFSAQRTATKWHEMSPKAKRQYDNIATYHLDVKILAAAPLKLEHS